jgi:alpha/beta superfamily hydrolase
VIVEGGDHFFEGHLPEMQAAIRDWTTRFLATRQKVEAK